MSLLGSLGTVSSAVGSFQSLVENVTTNSSSSSVSNAVSNAASNITNTVSSAASNIGNTASNAFSSLSSTLQNTAETLLSSSKVEFTKELYDKAISLAEALSVNLPVYEDSDKYKYGLFDGKKIYKDLAGNIDLTATNIKSCYGWLTVDKSSNEYVIFSNNDVSYIISYADFQSKPVVKDFTALYNKLSEASRTKDSYVDDTSAMSSLSTTYKDYTSKAIAAYSIIESINSSTPDEFKQAKKADYNYLTEDNPFLKFYDKTYAEDQTLKERRTKIEKIDFVNYYTKSDIWEDERHKPPVYTPLKSPSVSHNESLIKEIIQPNIHNKIETGNNSLKVDYRSVQAIIYDLPSDSTLYNQILYCYQQPESISYSASATYDNPSPRGAQQPFQFYTGANAITLSFELKFHYDELFTINGDLKNSSITSLQKIADIAESFTRPWELDNSVTPKVVKVLLPGIAETGYLTEASITYSGDMMGNKGVHGTKGDVLASEGSYKGEEGYNGHYTSTEYFYNMLTISFSLLVIKDVKLYSQKDAEEMHSHRESNSDAITKHNTLDDERTFKYEAKYKASDNSKTDSASSNDPAVEEAKQSSAGASTEENNIETPEQPDNQDQTKSPTEVIDEIADKADKNNNEKSNTATQDVPS